MFKSKDRCPDLFTTYLSLIPLINKGFKELLPFESLTKFFLAEKIIMHCLKKRMFSETETFWRICGKDLPRVSVSMHQTKLPKKERLFEKAANLPPSSVHNSIFDLKRQHTFVDDSSVTSVMTQNNPLRKYGYKLA